MRTALILFYVMALTHSAHARDLASTASRFGTDINNIAIAAIGIGLAVGAICFVTGMGHVGAMILKGTGIGAAFAILGPAVIQFILKYR